MSKCLDGVYMPFDVIDEQSPDLTPVVISVGQLVADDCSDSSVVHRPKSRNDLKSSLAAFA